MKKQKALDLITQEIIRCKVCKVNKIGIAVPGEGNSDSEIVFIGEAPGKKEAVTGKPFIGRSGIYLRKLIREILKLDDLNDVFITSPVKYLPVSGTPNAAEIAHGRTHLIKQLETIKPKIMVLMGNTAVQGMLQVKLQVKKEHGKIIEQNGMKYFITLHPAAGIRFPSLKEIIESDFRMLSALTKGI